MLKLPNRYSKTTTSFNNGGMSDVYVCDDAHLDRKVVVKSLKLSTDPKRLLDEIAALSELRSRHVVQIYDVIRNGKGEVQALVEEFLVGISLEQMPAIKTPQHFMKIALAVATGLVDMHDREIIHRDIKPSNMKFDSERCLKIFDFGLARPAKRGTTLDVVGTKGFMAPELFYSGADGSVKFSNAVDIFAFAATLLFAVKKNLPTCLTSMPPSLPCSEIAFSSLGFDLPHKVVSQLDQCFSTDPSKRPKSSEIVGVLRDHLLTNRHRAVLVAKGKEYLLDSKKRSVKIAGAGASLVVVYDGVYFNCEQIAGEVRINNRTIENGFEIRGACVIVLGEISLGSRRLVVTFDVSVPEIES